MIIARINENVRKTSSGYRENSMKRERWKDQPYLPFLYQV